MEKKTLHITQLFLDPENPRHDVISNQKEIIEELLKNEKVFNLAKDIAEQESLSTCHAILYNTSWEACKRRSGPTQSAHRMKLREAMAAPFSVAMPDPPPRLLYPRLPKPLVCRTFCHICNFSFCSGSFHHI